MARHIMSQGVTCDTSGRPQVASRHVTRVFIRVTSVTPEHQKEVQGWSTSTIRMVQC